MIVQNGTVDDTIDQNVIDGKVLSCSYVNVQLYNDDHDITTDLTIKVSFANKTITGTEKIDETTVDATFGFSYSDFGTTCPNKILKDDTDQKFYLSQADIPKGHTVNTFGLIKHLNYDEIEEGAGKTGCALIGDTTMSYIRKAYDLLRFIVPIIIIVFSIIDFAGVVISGEDDKMAKAKSKFIKRMIIGVVILFIPIILEILLQLVGILDKNERLVDIACLK